MRIRRVYEELLKHEKRTVLKFKCLGGGAAFLILAVFFITFLGLDVIRKIAKGFSYESGNCVVEKSVITGQNISCACGMHSCISRYPCLQVLVKITEGAERSNLGKVVLLRNNIYDLGSECTYGPPCKSNENHNFVSVLEYKRVKGQKGAVLECYFNPDKPEEVILDVSAHEMMTFHALFWPCCASVVGVCMLLKAWYLKRTLGKQAALPSEISLQEEWAFENNNKNDKNPCRKIKGSKTSGKIFTL